MKKHMIERLAPAPPVEVVELDEAELSDLYAAPDDGTFINFRELARFADEHLGDDRLEVTFALAVTPDGDEVADRDDPVDWVDEFGLDEGRCLGIRGITVCAGSATILLHRIQ